MVDQVQLALDPSRKKFWTLHLDQQTQSGQSVSIYCRVHQLNRGTFFKWRKRLAAGGNSSLLSLDRAGEGLWREYRLRANDENIIKENKEDFGLEGFALNGFYATEAAMLVRIMYYNILNLFRREMLPEPESHQRTQTLRLKYFISPALLGRNGKSPVLRLGIRKQNVRLKFIHILNKIST